MANTSPNEGNVDPDAPANTLDSLTSDEVLKCLRKAQIHPKNDEFQETLSFFKDRAFKPGEYTVVGDTSNKSPSGVNMYVVVFVDSELNLRYATIEGPSVLDGDEVSRAERKISNIVRTIDGMRFSHRIDSMGIVRHEMPDKVFQTATDSQIEASRAVLRELGL